MPWTLPPFPCSAFASLVFALLFLLADSAESGTIYGFDRVNRCYSCMSEWYEPIFRSGGMSHIFYEPKNFTRHCDQPSRPDLLDAVPCRTICLSIQQELVVVGQRTGQIITMRGCALSLAKRGMNNHTLRLLDRIDQCRDMNAADLFRSENRGETQRIRVCACLGDRCNGVATTSSSATILLSVSLIVLATFGLR